MTGYVEVDNVNEMLNTPNVETGKNNPNSSLVKVAQSEDSELHTYISYDTGLRT